MKKAHRQLLMLFVTSVTACLRGISCHLCNPSWMEKCEGFAVPNSGRRTTQDGLLETLHPGVSTQSHGCTNNMKLFLCQLIKHSCPPLAPETATSGADGSTGAPSYLPPCREACERLRDSCLPRVGFGVVSWADLVHCEALPLRSSRQCQWNIIKQRKRSSDVIPIISTESTGDKKDGVSNTQASERGGRGEFSEDDACECTASAGRRGVGRSVYFKRNFHYALHANYSRVEKMPASNLPTVIHLEVLDVLKSSSVPLSRGKQTLWSARGCFCSAFEPNTEYLILGYEDSESNRLLFNETCIATPWKKRWPTYIKKWDRRLQNTSKRSESAVVTPAPKTVSPRHRQVTPTPTVGRNQATLAHGNQGRRRHRNSPVQR